MTTRATIRLILTLWLCLSTALAAAAAPIKDCAVFEDRRADMLIEQVEQAAFTPSAACIISHGYTGSALWIRFGIDHPGAAGPLVLHILPAILDEVSLFRAGAGHGEGRRLLGHAAVLEAAAGATTHYLRVKNSGPMLVILRLLTASEAQQAEVTRGIALGVLLACGTLATIGLLILIVTQREMLHVFFLLHLAVSLALFLTAFNYLGGDGGESAWLGSTDHLLTFGSMLTTALFFRSLLARFGLPPWGVLLFRWFFILYIPVFVLYFAVDRQLALFLNTTLAICANTACMPLTFIIFRRHKPYTWLIAAVIMLVMLFRLRTFLMFYGIIVPSDEVTINFITTRSTFLIATFGAILWLIEREKQERLHAALTSEAVQRRLAEFEKSRREIQERFMAMLMHELKTPLAIIQLASTSLGRHLALGDEDAKRIKNIHRSVDDLNAIVERCVQADQIEQGGAPLNQRAFALHDLIDDLLQTLGSERIALAGPPACIVFSDYQYLRIILLNLLGNALKYSPADSMVRFDIQSAQPGAAAGLTFAVSNGVGKAGMPDPERLFARYYRAEGARRHVGAGLGLWLAQTMARQLGSEVCFQAGPEQVQFSFWLQPGSAH